MPEPAAAPLGRSGRWLTDAAGRVTTLHGVNMVNKLAPYHPAALGFGEQDARLIAGWGLNTVRIGWIWKALEPAPGEYDGAYLDEIAALARLLADHGMHVLVDFHQDMYNERFSGEGFPDWAVQDGGRARRPDLGFPLNYFFMPGLWRAYDNFWNNAPGPDGIGLQERFAAAWRVVAERLRDQPGVFYDIFNEPFPGSAAPLCAQPLGYPAFDGKLSALHRRALAAIRQVEPEKMVFYEPSVLFNNGSRTHHEPLEDKHTGLSFHNYCWATTPGLPRLRGPLQPLACARAEQRVMTNALDHCLTAGSALLMTEFGCTEDLANIERVCQIADRNMISWQYWAYYNEDPSAERPEENLVGDLSLPREAPNLRARKAETLSRPYPRAVAGTPLAFEYDPRGGVFTLAFSTRSPGDKAPTDPRTELFVPEHSFGRDFEIEVSGGEVDDVDHTSGLTWIKAGSGSERVDVRVVAG